MSYSTNPIIGRFSENDDFLASLREEIEGRGGKKTFLLDFPVVYIHCWKKKNDNPLGLYDIYIGESIDIVERTKSHHVASASAKNWQYHLTHDGVIPSLYIIGHEYFNKSLTLDIENRLIMYASAMSNIGKVHNGRGNPQNKYYPSDEFETIFNKIWAKLRQMDSDLFLPQSQIVDSAIYKASPLHKLTSKQIEAKEDIIRKVKRAIDKNLSNQLIFVEGEAGTGKTVLNSSTFYELLCRGEEHVGKKLKCCLVVNHLEQVNTYGAIFKRLNICKSNEIDKIVTKSTQFIHLHKKDNKVDVAFVDEAHLLLTQSNRGYYGTNQLQDIMDRAKVTVVMFDPNQVLTTEQIWEFASLDKFRKLSKKQHNYVELTEQLRMQCSEETKQWIDDFTKQHIVNDLPLDNKYSIKIFDSPVELHKAITKKANNENSKLSRIVASYDWEYSEEHRPSKSEYWNVEIDGWSLPWNRELPQKGRTSVSNLSWAEQPQTINECGSTYTIQGFDLSYVGVIIGPSAKYENGKIIFHPEFSKNKKAVRNRKLSNGKYENFAEQLLQNELRVLMTRGVKGLYIYACDDALRNALKQAAKRNRQ